MDNLTLVRTSSSSSLEDELAPGIFRCNPSKSGASLSQATVNQEETEESSGSVEREIFAWTKVLGITRRFFELKRDFLLGRHSEQHGAALTSRDTTKKGRA